MKALVTTCILALFLASPLFSRAVFDHRALLWWTPDKEIVLVIDHYSNRADILMQVDWQKIKKDRLVLQHDLIFLSGLRQACLPLKTCTGKRNRGLIKTGSLKNLKKEEILLQNGINYQMGKIIKDTDTSPCRKFGVPGF